MAPQVSDMLEEELEVKAIERILTLVQTSALLFQDQFNEPYAKIDELGWCIKIASSEFDDWLFNFLFQKLGHTSNDRTIKAATRIMKHQAKQQKAITLSVRVARDQNDIVYDLDGKFFAVINSAGWNVYENNPKPIFKRFGHQKAQDIPDYDGTIDEFFSLLNLSSKNDELLLKIYLVAAFIPGFPHPVFVMHGAQGSAKTTACRLLKELIDPSSLETTTFMNDKDIIGVIQTCSHHWLTVFDNLSYLPDSLSDVISRITTGGGISKRAHYTNDDDFIYNFMHLVGLNGINQVVSKSDLLDRTLIISLDRITEERRMTEEELKAKFKEMKPRVLGAIFDAVSGALKVYPSIKLTSMPRLADFAKWGCAIAVALGYRQEDFLSAYEVNKKSQNDEAIQADPLAAVIIKFMENKESFTDTATELYKALVPVAAELKLNDSRKWPKSPPAMSKQMTTLIPNLASVGIKVVRTKNDQRLIQITKSDSALDSNQDADPQLTAALAIFGGELDTTDRKDSTLPL